MSSEGSWEPLRGSGSSRTGWAAGALASSAQHTAGTACSWMAMPALHIHRCTSGCVLKALCSELVQKHQDGDSHPLSHVLPEPRTPDRSEQTGLCW